MKQPGTAKYRMGRLLHVLLPAIAILLIGAAAVMGLLVYKISHPAAVTEAVTPSHYLLPFLDVSIPAKGGLDLPAWWIPGLKGAPGIILAPGYSMSRSDALSLAAALHDNGFNLLVYRQRGGNPESKTASGLGLTEPSDMSEALRVLQGRKESNGKIIGIWGADIGAESALYIAAENPEVRVVVADGAFENPSDFLSYRIAEDFGTENKLVQLASFQVFRLAHVLDGAFSSRPLRLDALSDRAILFIKGENRKGLGGLTTAIYDKIQPQKEMISLATARTHMMSGEDLKSYDRQVTNFFSVNLR